MVNSEDDVIFRKGDCHLFVMKVLMVLLSALRSVSLMLEGFRCI